VLKSASVKSTTAKECGVIEMNRDIDEVVDELSDLYPDVDFDAVFALEVDESATIDDVVDALTSAGCDAEHVKRVLLDD
jgi:hypothetical protein